MRDFRTIQRDRAQALLSMWRTDPLIQVQSSGPDMLGRQVFLDDWGHTATVGGLGRRSQKNVLMVSRPGNPDRNASVWVKASYSGYRGAYLAFLKEAYSLKATSATIRGYDIDHLLNRARSPGGAGFIRLEAIDSAVNQAWGRLFEKTSSSPEFYATRVRKDRTMDWMICAKLGGQMPPSGPADHGGIARLVRFFTSIGIAADEAKNGLEKQLDFAYRRS